MAKKSSRRETGTPVGLDNVGNTCFMNSLLQFYFRIPALVKTVLQAKAKGTDQQSEFIRNLQLVFAQLIGSVKSSVSPKELLSSFEKASDNKIRFGEQEDIGEYHIIFVDTLQKALSKCEINISESDFKNLFNGVYREIVWMQKNGEMAKVNSKKVDFCPIIIGTTEDNLVSEWERNLFSDITGFKRESGNYTQARQEVWIKDLPKVLFFQIKRTFFVEGTNEGFKNYEGFDIPLVLYPDRMLKKNRKISLKLKEKCEDLRNKRKELQAEASFYSDSSSNSLEESIKTVIGFLKSERAKEFDVNAAGNAAYLESMQDFVTDKKKKFEESIKSIDTELEHNYESLNQTQYHLHSVLVHEGVSQSGHYFSLIREFTDKTWRRYNDTSVTIIEEEEVFNIAKGNVSYKSAYCLVYVSADEISQSSTGLPFITYDIDAFSGGDTKNEYSLYIEDSELINKVNSENVAATHLDTVDVTQDIVEAICITFQQKISTEMINYHNSFENFKEIQSFSSFFFKNQNRKFYNYSVLDYCTRYLTQDSFKSLDGKIQIQISRRLGISMNLSDLNDYERYINIYLSHLKYVRMALFILNNIENLKPDVAIRLYLYCFLTEIVRNQSVFDLLSTTFKLVLFYLIGDLINKTKENNIAKAVERCDIIHILHAHFKEHSSVKYLEDILNNIEKKYGSKFKADERDKYKQAISRAKSKVAHSDSISDQVFEDVQEFNENFSLIDPITYNDNGQTYENFRKSKEAVLKLFDKSNQIYARINAGKKPELKDFE